VTPATAAFPTRPWTRRHADVARAMGAALERMPAETRSFGMYEHATFGRLTAMLTDSFTIEVSIRDLAVHLWHRAPEAEVLDRVELALRRLHRRGVVEVTIEDGIAHVNFPRVPRRPRRNPR
jgi:hypothetical protein